MTLKISNSEMTTYLDCRRRWWLIYYRELWVKRDEEEPTSARNLGLRVHLVLKDFYEQGSDPLEMIKFIYEEDIRKLVKADRTELITELKEEQDLARIMIEGYVEWLAQEAIDAQYEVREIESIVEVPSPYPDVMLRGVLDQQIIRLSDGAQLFRDFKTVQSFEEATRTLYIDPQMRFYMLLKQLHAAYLERTHEIYSMPTVGALFTMLKKSKRTNRAKPPFYHEESISYNRDVIESTWIKVYGIVGEIIKTRDQLDRGADHRLVVPPRPSRDCGWKCPFLPVCGLFDDGSNVEMALAEHYEHRDPHERYNRENQEEKV